MRIVVGAYSFSGAAGTESYTATVTRELLRLGHEAIVAAEELGPMSDFAQERGIPVARRPADLPENCDAVFAQDAISAATLAERYPGTRLVHFAHSSIHDHQLPLSLPGVTSAVIVASDLIRERIQAMALDVPIVRLTQPIDVERFAPCGPIRERPRRALILSNYLRGARRRALVAAWEAEGVECVQVGLPTETTPDVVPAIREADIVVGKARAALEAMSCGRAVYVYDVFGGDGWVTPENYAMFEANNFAGRATTAPRTPAQLRKDIAAYRPEMGWVNHELVRTNHGARDHAARLVEVLRGPGAQEDDAHSLGEVARLTLLKLEGERYAAELHTELTAARERALVAEADADAARNRARELELQLETRRVRAGLAAGRVLDRLRGWR